MAQEIAEFEREIKRMAKENEDVAITANSL